MKQVKSLIQAMLDSRKFTVFWSPNSVLCPSLTTKFSSPSSLCWGWLRYNLNWTISSTVRIWWSGSISSSMETMRISQRTCSPWAGAFSSHTSKAAFLCSLTSCPKRESNCDLRSKIVTQIILATKRRYLNSWCWWKLIWITFRQRLYFRSTNLMNIFRY